MKRRSRAVRSALAATFLAAAFAAAVGLFPLGWTALAISLPRSQR